MGVRYVISWYEKDTNLLLGEIGSDPIPSAELQRLFTLSIQGALTYESHLINQQQAQTLSTWIPLLFDFTQYIYQLDCLDEVEISLDLTK